ncbi:hypothetical protein [Haloterrigena alkaliphila]|uniref:HhH-GPD family protein n=1 Tax=Haloterrigena alkaliphila TaxID=2816475 RepID=A0A8A2VBB3_9EURY|nr:hypothetical protein [Haloterrigena alkaliphila]QSW98436.1 hypothetical protein J0X25_13650 [Haloterrigena alkaliphila]
MSRSVQTVLDRYAEEVPYERLAAAVREHRRWTGDDPRLLVAEAAASTTGQSFLGGSKPTVERFRETFVATGRVDSFADLAALDLEDDDLVAAFGAQRKRHVLLEIARVLADRSADDDLVALVDWASAADQYRYDADPIGSIAGVGPSTFQYLRQLAGIDALVPDPTGIQLLEVVAADLESSPIDTATDLRTIASAEWLAWESSYTPLEIDRLAWWTFTDDAERDAILEVHGMADELVD